MPTCSRSRASLICPTKNVSPITKPRSRAKICVRFRRFVGRRTLTPAEISADSRLPSSRSTSSRVGHESWRRWNSDFGSMPSGPAMFSPMPRITVSRVEVSSAIWSTSTCNPGVMHPRTARAPAGQRWVTSTLAPTGAPFTRSVW